MDLVTELDDQDLTIGEELYRKRTYWVSREGRTRVEDLHSNLRAVNRLILCFGLDRHDSHETIGSVCQRNVDVVDFDLPDATGAPSYMSFEMVCLASKETGDEIVVSDHGKETLFID